MLEVRKTRALVKSEKYDEISRFLHYYERYKEHIKSLSVSGCGLCKMGVVLKVGVRKK